MISHRLFPALLSFLAIAGAAPLFAQQDLSNRILADHPAFVINNLDVVENDVTRLIFDVTQKKDAVFPGDVFKVRGTGIDGSGGVIFYYSNAFKKQVIEYRLSDTELADSHFNNDAAPDDAPQKWRALKNGDGKFPFVWIINFLMAPTEYVGLRIDDRFFVAIGDNAKDFDWLVAGKPKLATKMDPVSHDIINKSGITFVVDKKNLDLSEFFSADDIVDESNFQSLTESERKWLKELASRAVEAEYALVGLKYHDRVMEMRNHVKLSKEARLDDLFNTRAAEKPFDAALGFESKDLAGVIAVDMESFKSPAAARAIPKLAFSEFYHGSSTQFLNGNMLQLLSELVGDSRNDLSAARLAVYENEADKDAGLLSIVAVVDAKDPQQVITELEKISALAMPADKNAEAEAKRRQVIADLIKDLESDAASVASRAETRLKLGGEVAAEAINGKMSNLNPRAKLRARRVLKAIKRILKSQSEKTAVLDPEFWTTLNPKLEFKTAEKTTDGFNAFAIEISPDPSKSETEVQQASEMMKGIFGTQWNKIPVIQVDDHFVFMIGSNQKKLDQICRNVKNKKSDLLDHLKGVGDGSKEGQFQVIFNPERLDRVFGISGRSNLGVDGKEKEPADDAKLCWMGVRLQNNSASAEVLLPIEQFQGFFSVMQ